MKETKTLEFKSEISSSFLKTVSAFANFGTGTILFGVADDGSVLGMEHPEQVCLNLENKINDSIAPKPDFSFSIDRKTGVVTLTVREGLFKPYLYKGKAYRRSDTASIETDSVELKRLIMEGEHLYFDAIANEKQDFSFLTLEKVLTEKLGLRSCNHDTLRTLGFFTPEKKYNNAAALLADTNDFPGIDMARFGDSINEITDRETISGVSVLTQFEKSTALFKKYYQYETVSGFERVKTELIPELAFREIIANALIHRCWDIGSHIRVAMYSDRVEIVSPGGLPKEVSEKDYLNGNLSYLRNPTLGMLFFRLGFIEMFGTGVQRVLQSYSSFYKKPAFFFSDTMIKVILPVCTQNGNMTSDELRILNILKTGILLSSSELAVQTGFSRDKVIRIVKELKQKNAIKTVGNGRGTKYSV